MKKIIALTTFFCYITTFYAQNFIIPLSDDGEANLYAFLPEQPTGRAIVAIPGGGYKNTSIDNYIPWAKEFNEMGITFFCVKYRMPEGDRTIPIGDAEAAFKMVRDSASVWNINPKDIGVMGASAGGHLATTIVTHSEEALRPNFQILFYPVITFGEGCHKGSRDRFLGEGKDDEKLIAEYSNEKQVTKANPPAIILVNSDDKTVPPIENSIAYYEAMLRHHCNASLHVYPSGGHSRTYNPENPFHEAIVNEVKTWLNRLKN